MNVGPRILIPLPTSGDVSYNRECWPQYAQAVREAGGTAVECALTMGVGDVAALARDCEGVLLPGSPADVSPERYGDARQPECGAGDALRETCDAVLLRHAFAVRKPVLGVCYGMQSLNVFRRGTLVQDLSPIPVNHAAGARVEVAHGLTVEAASRLGELAAAAGSCLEGECVREMVNSSHHQAVAAVGDGLRVVAWSKDDLVAEAVEVYAGADWFSVGVQWHPERTTESSAFSRAIFNEFVAADGRWRDRVERGTV